MTPQEFKAWFDGFTEALPGLPNETQWGKIKERVAQIDGKPVSYPVYVDRYWPSPRRYWETPYWLDGGVTVRTLSGTSTLSANADNSADKFREMLAQDPLPAMKALGYEDFKAVS
jgi:hypothetical protein